MTSEKKGWGLSFPFILWSVGFTLIPLAVITRYAFTDPDGGLTLDNVLAMGNRINGQAFLVSLLVAFICTLLCVLLAYPMVMAIRRLNLSSSAFILIFLILPMWMNFILRILAWQMILSDNGILNHFLTILGLPKVFIANTWLAVIIGVTYDYFPYMMLPIYTAVSAIEKDITEAARDLGAGTLGVFTRVIFPLSLPGLFSGITMVFVPSMTSFAVADILGGGKTQLIGNIIEQEFMRSSEMNLGSGLSISLMIFMLITLPVTVGRSGKEEGSRDI